jgi:hypothetical protein
VKVEVFLEQEGAQDKTHVTADFSGVKTDHNMKDNPSPYRQGLIIFLGCETCNGISQLHIYQHKGCTCMEMLLTNETWFEGNVFP